MHKYYWINQNDASPDFRSECNIHKHIAGIFKDPEITMSAYFNDSRLLREFPVLRSGKTVEYGYIYLLQGYKNTNLEGILNE